jgi:hypothetical protein
MNLSIDSVASHVAYGPNDGLGNFLPWISTPFNCPSEQIPKFVPTKSQCLQENDRHSSRHSARFYMIFDFFIQQCILLLTHFLSAPREQPISPSKTASNPSHRRPSNASAALFTSTSTSTHRAPARARTAASSPAHNSALYRAILCARPGLVEWEKNSEIMEKKGKREQKACVRVCESVRVHVRVHVCVCTETLRAAAGPRRRMEKGRARLHEHDVRRSEKNSPGNMGI